VGTIDTGRTSGTGPANPLRRHMWIVVGGLALIAVGFAVLIAVARRNDSAAAAFRRINRLQESMAAEQRRRFEKGETDWLKTDQLAELAAEVEAAGAESGNGVLVCMGRFHRGLANAAVALDGTTRAWVAAGGLSVEKVWSPADLAARRALVAEARTNNERFRGLLRGAPVLLRGCLEERHVSQDTVDAALKQLEGVKGIATGLQVRDIEDRVLASCDAALAVLDREWGRWQWDATAGALTFESQATLAEYNGHILAIQRAATQEVALQGSALGVTPPRQKVPAPQITPIYRPTRGPWR
jgi:hypothetical protein